MNDKIEKLIEIMEREASLYQELFQILKVEKQCMTDLSLDRLRECHDRKGVIIFDIEALEESRINTIELIQNGHYSGAATFNTIIDMVPARYKNVLEGYRSQMLSLISSIRKINQMNSFLSERLINHTRHSLSFLNRLASGLQDPDSSNILSRR